MRGGDGLWLMFVLVVAEAGRYWQPFHRGWGRAGPVFKASHCAAAPVLARAGGRQAYPDARTPACDAVVKSRWSERAIVYMTGYGSYGPSSTIRESLREDRPVTLFDNVKPKRILLLFGVYEGDRPYAAQTLDQVLDLLAPHELTVHIQDDASPSYLGRRLAEQFSHRVNLRLARIDQSLGYHGSRTHSLIASCTCCGGPNL